LDCADDAPSVVVRVGSGGDDVTDGRSKHGAYSLDGGLTWTPFATEPPDARGSGAITVTADGKTFLWAAQAATLSYSRDYGTTWIACGGLPQPDPSEPRSYFGQIRLSMTADRVNPRRVYALNGKTLFVSADGGATFSPAAAVGLPAAGGTLDAAPGVEGDLWVTAGDTGLWHSSDSGATFTAIPAVSQADGLGFGKSAPGRHNPALYLVGTPAATGAVHGVYRSDDSGAHWVRINDDQHQYGWIGRPIAGDPRVYGRVYLGTNGRGILVGDISPTR
jgi:xyloglucan-specific exo-beta-1,4-glucanase